MKRHVNNESSSSGAAKKKIKVEKLPGHVESEIKTEVKVEAKRRPNVRVELQVNIDDDYDLDSWDEKEHTYVNLEDEEKCNQLKEVNYGAKREYSCTRQGSGRVLVDDVNVGDISFYLIDRSKIAEGRCPDMVEVCDAETAELYDLALKYFEEDGSLKNPLAKRVGDIANYDHFMYIEKIDLKAPYDRLASDDNVHVAADAIDKFLRSPAFSTDVVTVTFAMYISDGLDKLRRHFDPWVSKQDARQFTLAGFETIPNRKGGGEYMYCNLFP